MDQSDNVMQLMTLVIKLENRVSALEEIVQSMQGQIPTVKPKISKKYMPITKYLESCKEDVVPLSFKNIEDMLRENGTYLPKSAYNHQAFWANSDTHSIALSWMAAGFEVDGVDREAGEVVFRRSDR